MSAPTTPDESAALKAGHSLDQRLRRLDRRIASENKNISELIARRDSLVNERNDVIAELDAVRLRIRGVR